MLRSLNGRSGLAVVIAFAVVALGSPAMAACQAGRTVGLDLTTVTPCVTEDGSFVGDAGYPCVWDGQSQGDGRYGAGTARWLLYVDTGCPVATVQPTVDVECIDVREWLQGPAGTPAG